MGVVVPAPHDHLAAGPHRRVILSGKGGICRTCGYPTVSAGIVSATGVKIHAWETKDAAPNDHFAGVPHCTVRVSRRGCIQSACSRPAIGRWVVSSPCVAIIERRIHAAPDHHFATRPQRRVSDATQHIIGDARGRPTVRAWIVSAAGV